MLSNKYPAQKITNNLNVCLLFCTSVSAFQLFFVLSAHSGQLFKSFCSRKVGKFFWEFRQS